MSTEHDPGNPYATVNVALASYAELLLENATRHTETWQRANYEIPRENYADLFQALSQPPFDQLVPRPGEEIPSLPQDDEAPVIAGELPDTMLIGIEHLDYGSVGEDWAQTTVDIGLTYKQFNEGGELAESATVRLKHTLGSDAIYRNVVMWRYAETGYEGHAYESVDLSPEDLTSFLELLTTNTGRLLPQTPFMEWMRKIVYICVDTGKEFRYDDELKTHVAEDGTTSTEYISPIASLEEEFTDPDNSPTLKEKARFRVQFPGQ